MSRIRDKGVSLLETMIALMVMAMLAVMIANAFGFQTRVLQRLGGTDVSVNNALNLRDLRRWLEDIPGGLNQGAPMEMQGAPTVFRFASVDVTGRFWQGAPISVELSVRNGALVAQASGLNPDREPISFVSILASAPVQNVRIRYYGRHALDSEAQWKTEWTSAPRLPSLIRIDWERANAGQVPFVFEPGLTQNQSLRELTDLVPDG
ncbi:MAG: prepilin-type N-terminal cleavage/methylation domain-containing protein [Paracoccaceae bacterium]